MIAVLLFNIDQLGMLRLFQVTMGPRSDVNQNRTILGQAWLEVRQANETNSSRNLIN